MDGLRCVAILPVVWHHSTSHAYDGALGRGPLGVDLFFALSGFLITSLLLAERPPSSRGLTDLREGVPRDTSSRGLTDLREGVPRDTSSRGLASFWMRRSLRIFPLYYFVLGLFVLHAALLREDGPVRSHFLASVVYYATYTSNLFLWQPVDHPIVFAFAWSLAAEEQFYLWWPIVLRAFRTELAAMIMFGVIAIDQAAESGLLPAEGFTLNLLRSFATPIGLGALLAIVAPRVRMPRWGSLATLAFVVFAVVKPLPLLPTQVLLTFFVGACALRRDHWLAPLLENRVVRHVGVVSYGIYLLNVPVVAAVRAVVGRNDAIVFVAATFACAGVATITRRLVELPFLRLRDRFALEFSPKT